jgi:hypothetical protein
MSRIPSLLLLPLIAAGCASPPAVSRLRVATEVETALTRAAADQVKRCYRPPRVPAAGKRIVTRLRVRFAADGRLVETPLLVSQQGVTPENSPYAGPMAEAASMAVIRCAPLRLPGEPNKGGWGWFDLTFSPRAMA